MATPQAESANHSAASPDVQRVVAPDASERIQPSTPHTAAPTTKGLIFEVANVLYDATLWWRWLITLWSRLHPQVDVERLARCWHAEYLAEVRRGRREFGEAFESFLRDAQLARGEADEILAAGLSRRRDLEFEVYPFPGVKSTLRRLHKLGVEMVIVTDSANTSQEWQLRLARWGLNHYFSQVLSSVELGEIKPGAACYEAAIACFSHQRDQLVFIGQSVDELAGARRLGLRTIACNPADHVSCDHRLARFDSLTEVVAAPHAPVHGSTSVPLARAHT